LLGGHVDETAMVRAASVPVSDLFHFDLRYGRIRPYRGSKQGIFQPRAAFP